MRVGLNKMNTIKAVVYTDKDINTLTLPELIEVFGQETVNHYEMVSSSKEQEGITNLERFEK